MVADVVLALDVSTSIIGWSILYLDSQIGDPPITMGHIDLRKIKTGFWGKVDEAKLLLEAVIDVSLAGEHNCVRICIENPVKRFRRGMSSAHTIALLAKFNVLISYFVRQRLGLDPFYIDASEARRALGIKLVSKAKAGGKNEKEQTFEQLSETVFHDVSWPMTKKGNIQAFCYDRVDAYVIGLAGALGLGEV